MAHLANINLPPSMSSPAMSSSSPVAKVLSSLGTPAGELLKRRKRPDGKPETVTVFEATTGGLVQAALQSVPGASRFYHAGSNATMNHKLYPAELRELLAIGGAQVGAVDRGSNYASRISYQKSKVVHTMAIAKRMREYMGATWCLAESGAAGPTFAPPDMEYSFSVVCVEGPGISKVALFESGHNDRETSMWQFAAAALQFLEGCIAEVDDGFPAKL